MFTRRVWRTSTAVRKGARRHPLSSTLTFILGLGPALFLAQPVRAQISTTATISGTVSDPSGAAVAGAKVTVMNENTGVTTTTQSNADGSFVASGLPVGNYKVSVVKEGFRTFTEEHIVVHPATVTNVTAVLQLGQVSSEISVVASAQQVQTATSEVSSQVSEQQVETLPLNGRNYQSLSALMPGVTNTSPGSAQNQGGFLTSNTMSINGMGQSGTLYTLDGIWNMNTGNMTQTTITPNPDTIQEVRVLQNNYSVQYSIMGANVVLLQTKSGTDQFHGSNGVPLNFADKHKWVWSPQIGFAYDIFGDGKTALRGGYGITYNRVPTGTDCSYFCGDNPPRVQSITLTPVSFPNSTGGKPAPPGALTLSASEDLNLKPVGMLQTYSLSIEHQFGSWITSLAGAGNIGHNMGTYWDRNQPFPVNGAVPGYPSGSYNYDPRINFDPARNAPDFEYYFAPYQGYAGMNTNVSLANARWNALEVNVRHPVGSNLFLSAAYTWQHGLSDTRGLVFFENNNTTQDIYHPRAEYGTSNLNAYHILSVSYIWSLPWYQNAKGIEGAALGGWKYSGIATIQSGFAQDAGLSVANQGIAKLPDRTGTAISGSKTVNEWFNTAAFAAPAFGFFGSAGTGSIMGPGLVNFDMAFYKTFRFTERQNLEFRAELFNIFNHTNFNALSRNLGAGDFGKVTSARDPRIVEFALRYHF